MISLCPGFLLWCSSGHGARPVRWFKLRTGAVSFKKKRKGMLCFVGVWVLGLYFRAEASRGGLSRGAHVSWVMLCVREPGHTVPL